MHIRSPKWFFIAVIFSVLALAPAASATTYYIAANGSDSNNGTSKSTPWLHAPGMPNCAATCASVKPAAGDQFIFRGGDTWHWGNSSAASYVGGRWDWTWAGASGSPIYIGVDKTWYSGSSWTRPVLNRDNPLSTSQVSSCRYDNSSSGAQIQFEAGADYVTFDNFEFVGTCWVSASGANNIVRYDAYNTVENVYIHGWTHAACPSGSCDTGHFLYTGLSASHDDVLDHVVVDGSDSPPYSGFAVLCPSGDTNGVIENSVFRYLSNAVVCSGVTQLHDNLFEYIHASYDHSTHGNVVEWDWGVTAPIYVYNNIFRYSYVGVMFWPTVYNQFYFFNNIVYGMSGSSQNPDCIMLSNMRSGGSNSFYIFNNTLAGGCVVRYSTNSGTACPSGNVYYTNNHLIGYGSPGNLSNVTTSDSGCSVTEHETDDVYQSTSTAASQGYVNSSTGYCANDTTPCAPTAGSAATVGAAVNETSSCSTFGSALCSDTTLAVAYNTTTHVTTFPARTPNPRPSSGAWDAGAYMYGTTTATAPKPPTNLTDVVH